MSFGIIFKLLQYKLVLYNYVCHCVLYIQQSPYRTPLQIIIQYLEKLCICRDHRAHRCFGLDKSEFTKSVIFYFFTLFHHIASVNSVVDTVLHLLWAFIVGITPTNYSVSYIVKNATHKSESRYRPFTIINCQTVYYLGRRG